MLNLNSIMIGSMQPQVLADFYEKVLGRPADMVDGGWYGWKAGNCFISIGEHSEAVGMSKDPVRVMFVFETPDVKEEFERIKSSGATVIKEPYYMADDKGNGAWIATLADPDGNYFQLMPPWDPQST